MADHHGIGRSGALYARGNIGGLSQRQLFLPLCSAHFPNNDQSGMNPDTDGELDTWSVLQRAMEFSHGRKHP
jgi:hypothetical protein